MQSHENPVAEEKEGSLRWKFFEAHGLVACPVCGEGCQVGPSRLERFARTERRMKAYRFVMIVLFCLLVLASLTIRAYQHEMSFAADQLRQANDRLREDRAAFTKDLATLRACQERVDMLAIGRAAELLR